MVFSVRGIAGSVAVAAALFTAQAARAQASNDAPPPGAILDLAGQAVNHGAPELYSVTFTAGTTSTDIAFAFRDDPAFLLFSNASVVDSTSGSGNLLTNGDFSGGTTSTVAGLLPDFWNYQNQFAATYSGQLSGTTWVDGSVQAYDSLDQTIATVVGDTYTISFDLTEDGNLSTYSDLSTNGDVTNTGGNGVDVLVYATSAFNINAVPEPGTAALIGASLLGLAVAARRRAA